MDKSFVTISSVSTVEASITKRTPRLGSKKVCVTEAVRSRE